ncbi:MAG: ABC transporter ATP-binding protein [Acidimicrobiales bacterium]
MSIESIVSVRDVRRSFGRTVALDGIDLDLGTGVTGFLGPNGAGKTTLLRILATALAPDSGTVRILGHDPATADGRYEIRCTLGYVPQEPGFHTRFTTFEFVDYIAILKELTDRRQRHDEVRRVLDQVGLGTVMHKRIGKLSGGMRRRVAIAQALLGHPQLLVLDEPTAGLDPEQRLRFREVVGTVAEHHTVVLATHQTEDVSAMCGRVAVIDEGRVLYDGTPADLAAVAAGKVWLADHPGDGARLSWRTASGRYRVIGDAPDRAEPAEPTIEDAYLLLAGERAMGEEASAA